MIFAIEQERRERLAELGLADARGPEKEERPGRPVRVRQTRARAADRVGDRGDRLVLADDALVQLGFHLQQLVALALHELGDRDAGRARDDLGDLLGTDDGSKQLRLAALGALLLLVRLRFLDLSLEFGEYSVLQLGDLVEVAFPLQLLDLRARAVDLLEHLRRALCGGLLGLPDLFEIGDFALDPADLPLDEFAPTLRRLVFFLEDGGTLDLQLDQPAIEPVERFRLRIALDADLGSGFVDQIDRLVRKEAVGDVALRKLGRRDDRRVGDLHAVVCFVLLLQSAQDRDGRLDARLADQDLLEAPLERGVLLDVLAVLVERGRADAVQLAARERGLEHVAGVDRALGLAGADHGVELVDEDDRLAFVLRDFLEHRLQPLLELAAVLRAGEQQRHVEDEDALVLERIGNLAGDDPLGQAFHDRGLADARLADQHRVVLGAPLQDLDRAADLVIAADHRVELAGAGALRQIERVLLQRLALAFGLGAVDLLAAAHRLDRSLERLAAGAELLEQRAELQLRVGSGEHEHLARDELVAALGRFLLGRLQQGAHLAPGLDLLSALHLRQPLHGVLERGLQLADVDSGAGEQGLRAVGLRQHRGEHVDGLDVRVLTCQRQALRFPERLLEGRRQLVDSHGSSGSRRR